MNFWSLTGSKKLPCLSLVGICGLPWNLGVEEAVCVYVQCFVSTGAGQMTDGVFDLPRKPYRSPKLLPLLPIPV